MKANLIQATLLAIVDALWCAAYKNMKLVAELQLLSYEVNRLREENDELRARPPDYKGDIFTVIVHNAKVKDTENEKAIC